MCLSPSGPIRRGAWPWRAAERSSAQGNLDVTDTPSSRRHIQVFFPSIRSSPTDAWKKTSLLPRAISRRLGRGPTPLQGQVPMLQRPAASAPKPCIAGDRIHTIYSYPALPPQRACTSPPPSSADQGRGGFLMSHPIILSQSLSRCRCLALLGSHRATWHETGLPKQRLLRNSRLFAALS